MFDLQSYFAAESFPITIATAFNPKKISDFQVMKKTEKQLRKERIIKAAFGKINFDKCKTPEAIQGELRSEWITKN